MTETKLTLKEQRFVTAYLGAAAGNASEAARIAGYKDGGEFGYRLLKRVEVRAHIDAILMTEAMTPAEILRELRDVGTAEWRDFITVRTHPKTGETVEVKMDLSAKMKALELNGKFHKMFVEKMEVTGKDGEAISYTLHFDRADDARELHPPDPLPETT